MPAAGPHNGARNTSMGLALLRPDGFGGLVGSGTATTTGVLVTGAILTVSCDIRASGSVRVGAIGHRGLGVADATAVTASVTDGRVAFGGGASFAALVGSTVELAIEVTGDAMVYTVGFTQ